MTLRMILAASLMAAAFVQAQTPAIPSNCAMPPVPNKCNNDSSRPNTIRVQKNANGYFLTPANFCASPGDQIEFLLPRNASIPAGGASIVPKSSAGSWLSGSNGSDAGAIRISVPDVPDGEYDYAFIAPDGCVDPRIEVRGRSR